MQWRHDTNAIHSQSPLPRIRTTGGCRGPRGSRFRHSTLIMDRSTPPQVLGAPFLGFMLGSILFGVALLQTYQYFLHYVQDSRWRKTLIAVICGLDSTHLVFSAIMMYSSFSSPSGFSNDNYLWTLKGFATSKALLIVLVQGYYLLVIWRFARNITLDRVVSKVIQFLSVLVFLYATGVAIAFLTYLEQVKSFYSFSVSFQNMIFIGFGSTVLIDCTIAATMSFLLFKTSSGNSKKSRSVIRFLVMFFIGTGLLTAIAAIATIAVYVSRPSTVLYLGIEFSVPRLYANSILVMFNSKERLRKKMQATTELQLSSKLLFEDFSDPQEEGVP
ncbi:hypothetical protein BDZ97DRAFT_1788921 [Flammula alnicola]|nr:hypothetical protein BDZ97DRAFT_1788921 [Flammula alnicola]